MSWSFDETTRITDSMLCVAALAHTGSVTTKQMFGFDISATDWQNGPRKTKLHCEFYLHWTNINKDIDIKRCLPFYKTDARARSNVHRSEVGFRIHTKNEGFYWLGWIIFYGISWGNLKKNYDFYFLILFSNFPNLWFFTLGMRKCTCSEFRKHISMQNGFFCIEWILHKYRKWIFW